MRVVDVDVVDIIRDVAAVLSSLSGIWIIPNFIIINNDYKAEEAYVNASSCSVSASNLQYLQDAAKSHIS